MGYLLQFPRATFLKKTNTTLTFVRGGAGQVSLEKVFLAALAYRHADKHPYTGWGLLNATKPVRSKSMDVLYGISTANAGQRESGCHFT